jgi:tetratricopeptide (TPR) repeat protein
VRLKYLVLLASILVARADGADPALSFLEARVGKDPDDFVAQNQLAARYLDLVRLSGDNDYRVKARRAAEASVEAGSPESNPGGLAALAQVQLASHQFAAARDNATKLLKFAPGKSYPFAILGDALLELGDYSGATAAFARLAEAEPRGLNSESRLARLAFVQGKLDEARRHWMNAEEAARNLTPPVPALQAWVAVQLGEYHLRRGDWRNAEKQYQTALELVPEYWAALDHLAELRGAQERYPEAISIYERLVERVRRPELMQALGDLLVFGGKVPEAKPWHERAVRSYLKFAEQGDASYYHHLSGFYADSVEQPDEALRWARQDLEIRQNVYAHDAMAWALYRNGQFAEAAAEMVKALGQGTQDAHLLFHASMIATANGDVAKGKELLARTSAVNPHHHAFHVHR